MRIAIAAPCTGTKRISDGITALGRVAGAAADVTARFGAWTRAIDDAVAGGPTVPAGHLYAGQTWSVVEELFGAAAGRGLDVHPLVLSAGLGLIHTEVPIPPYSATFTSGIPDSVSLRRDDEAVADHRAWWDLLGHWRGATLEGLAGSVDGILIAATPAYAAAIRDDLRCAMAKTPVVIVTTVSDDDPAVAARTVLVSQHHRREDGLVRASDQSLAPKVAGELLRRLGPDVLDADRARSLLQRHVGVMPFHPPRTPIGDDELNDYLRRALGADPTASWSALHSELRYQQARQVGTTRFKRLFEAAGGILREKRSGNAAGRDADV